VVKIAPLPSRSPVCGDMAVEQFRRGVIRIACNGKMAPRRSCPLLVGASEIATFEDTPAKTKVFEGFMSWWAMF